MWLAVAEPRSENGRQPSLIRSTVQICCHHSTSLTPSSVRWSMTQAAISSPSAWSDVMMSRAWPVPCSPESPGRRPPYDVTCGKAAQTAR